MKNAIFLIGLLFFLFSCDKSNDSSTSNTLKVTASTGTTKVMTNFVKGSYTAGSWDCNFFDPTTSYNKTYTLEIDGITDAGGVGVYIVDFPTIKEGELYTYTSGQYQSGLPHISMRDWVDADGMNSVKYTVQFSSFKYPGRITGTAFSYDKNGKQLIRAEFDFISTKVVN